MRSRWFIELQGHAIDLERMAAAFTNPPVTIVKEDEQYRLHDEFLAGCDSADSACSGLERTIMRVNAVARLWYGADHDNVRRGRLGSVDESGAITWHDSGTVRARVRASSESRVVGADGGAIPPPASPLPAWLQLAARDHNVDDALYFLQQPDPDWIELYKVYEVVRSESDSRVEDRGWASRQELSRFTRTANHQDAAGRVARHARMNAAAPPSPMSLKDARALIRRVLRAWIDAKTESPARRSD